MYQNIEPAIYTGDVMHWVTRIEIPEPANYTKDVIYWVTRTEIPQPCSYLYKGCNVLGH